MNSSAAHLRAQIAHGSRRETRYSPERLAALRRDFHAARLEESLRKIVAEAGPFTPEQAQGLSSIIAGPAAAAT